MPPLSESLTHAQLDFLLDVATASEAKGLGLLVTRSKRAPAMPAGLVASIHHGGHWLFTLTAKGERMVAAVRAHDRRRAS